MSDTVATPAAEPVSSSFMSGIGDIFSGLGGGGGIASIINSVTGRNGSATPGATGAGTPAALATTQTGSSNNTIAIAAIAGVGILVAIGAIVLVKR